MATVDSRKPQHRKRFDKFFVSSLFLVSFLSVSQVAGESECDFDEQCQSKYNPGSTCSTSGFCTNPFAYGCLHNYDNYHNNVSPSKMRTCNSNDQNNVSTCNVSPFGYSEIRIHNSNWESSIIYSWIAQIFLSEFLDVPATVGLSTDVTKDASFYNPDNIISYSTEGYPFDALVKSNEMKGRCDLTAEPCVHVLPEVWSGQEKQWDLRLQNREIDQLSWSGQVGKISWFIPKYTAERFPEFSTFLGMSMQREKLAEVFLRPTNWGDYCSQVSLTNCTEPDGVASRAPERGEEDAYFEDDLYTGFFRSTQENNCTANPNSCTGHIVGTSCGWSTHLDAQIHHNNIALSSSGPLPENQGYEYAHMIQIWKAANATQSDVAMWWWTPDATVEEFRGTPFQFQQVLLPEPTFECREARVGTEDRCSSNETVRMGNPLSGCDDEANSLQKVIAMNLKEQSYSAKEVDKSPAYEAIRNLMVSQFDMNEILREWVDGGRSGIAARQAVCTWVIDHQDELTRFIPSGFPRVVEVNTYHGSLLTAALVLGMVALCLVLAMMVLVHIYRNKDVFIFAQIPFVYMVLIGLLLVACGVICLALEPQDGTCVAQVWLVTIGQTLQLVPLLVKISAIHRVMMATRRMRRIQISMRTLFVTVAGVVGLVAFFLLVWTLVDPPQRTEGRFITADDTIITTLSCSQDSKSWEIVALVWQALLIICATVLAFQTRFMKEEFNESRSLGTMVYSHFVLTVLYGAVSQMGVNHSTGATILQPETMSATCGIILSFDVIASIAIYFAPKLCEANKLKPPKTPFVSADSFVMALPDKLSITLDQDNSSMHRHKPLDDDFGLSLNHSLNRSLNRSVSRSLSRSFDGGTIVTKAKSMPSIEESEFGETTHEPSCKSAQEEKDAAHECKGKGDKDANQGPDTTGKTLEDSQSENESD